MTASGTVRLHFNRAAAAPIVWSVSTHEWSLDVSAIVVRGLMRSVYKPKDTADEDDGKPSAWFEVTGLLVVRDGVAVIEAA